MAEKDDVVVSSTKLSDVCWTSTDLSVLAVRGALVIALESFLFIGGREERKGSVVDRPKSPTPRAGEREEIPKQKKPRLGSSPKSQRSLFSSFSPLLLERPHEPIPSLPSRSVCCIDTSLVDAQKFRAKSKSEEHMTSENTQTRGGASTKVEPITRG